MTGARRILVRGVNWLGDAVMTTPALMALRDAQPDAHITLLTPSKLADLWHGHPALNTVLAFERQESIFDVARKIRRQAFDLAIVLPNSPRSALEVFFGRVPVRIGFRRLGRSWALTDPRRHRQDMVTVRKSSVARIKTVVRTNPTGPRVDYPDGCHQVLDYLVLMAAVGAKPTPCAPALFVPDEEVATARKRFAAPPGRALFGLNAGAEYGPAKRWPADRFIEAARMLIEQTGAHWWILGGPGDVALADSIAGQLPQNSVRSLAGKTSLRELCAVLKACQVVLTNDTGPMHVAAAVGTPVVVPFGSTCAELTGPGWPPGAGHELLRGEAPCAPCFRRACPIDFRCMRSITVDAAVRAVLRAWRPIPPHTVANSR
jgi:heptosyltransferase II